MRNVPQRRLPHSDRRRWLTWLGVAGLLSAAALLGRRPSARVLALPLLALGALALLWRPALGPLAMVVAALLVPRQIGTGTDVALNAAVLIVPILLGVGVLDRVRRREMSIVSSKTNRPLLLFLLAGLLSLLAGNALWAPTVPRPANMTVVQLAQWGLFAISAGAFWLAANLVSSESWLQRLVWFFLLLAVGTAILWQIPSLRSVVQPLATTAFTRAPLWALLTAVAGGQLVFNANLGWGRRLYLFVVLGAVLHYAFVLQIESISTWLGVVVVWVVLLWLRFPKVRVVSIVAVLLLSGVLSAAVWELGGGAEEWDESGGSRLVLIERVLEVSMRNPITGLGPASYRPYAATDPLPYRGAYWVNPQVSSHNNYVDLFAHVGLLGLGLLGWFWLELGRLGWRLNKVLRPGFAAGYVNGMLAMLAASLALMLLADWILPFVYNIGFPGFQASVLVWLFWGGTVAVAQWGALRVEA